MSLSSHSTERKPNWNSQQMQYGYGSWTSTFTPIYGPGCRRKSFGLSCVRTVANKCTFIYITLEGIFNVDFCVFLL